MRTIALIFLILISNSLWAQRAKKKPPKQEGFLDTQWFLGFYGGANLTSASPTSAFYGYAPLNYDLSAIGKTYEDYSIIGGQYGLIFMYYFNGFTIGSRPGFNIYGFEHRTTTQWTESENSNNTLEVSYQHTTNLNYLEFPLTLQYDLTRSKLRPYVGVGAYYGMLFNATRTIERSGVDAASGSEGDFDNQSKTIGVDELFIRSSIGIVGFIGASYDPGNVRITMDIGYKYGMKNITSIKNRYLKNDLAAIGDATDDLQLQHIYLSLGVAVPLKFITNNYSSKTTK